MGGERGEDVMGGEIVGGEGRGRGRGEFLDIEGEKGKYIMDGKIVKGREGE